MLIATWNVNSVRVRLPQLKQLLVNYQPDIIALQETKVQDMAFPIAEIKNFGYSHVLFRGEKSYNGVALLSKQALTPGPIINFGGKADCRHLSCVLPNGALLHNFYVPAGGDIPDPHLNPKYAHKIQFLKDMKKYLKQLHQTKPMVILGDINIAPGEHDVWNHKQMQKVVCHTPLEIENLSDVMTSLDVFDAARSFVSAEKKLYSWWSYRNVEITEKSRGLRLDQVWLPNKYRHWLKSCWHLSAQRLEPNPSDHVAVLAELHC